MSPFLLKHKRNIQFIIQEYKIIPNKKDFMKYEEQEKYGYHNINDGFYNLQKLQQMTKNFIETHNHHRIT